MDPARSTSLSDACAYYQPPPSVRLALPNLDSTAHLAKSELALSLWKPVWSSDRTRKLHCLVS